MNQVIIVLTLLFLTSCATVRESCLAKITNENDVKLHEQTLASYKNGFNKCTMESLAHFSSNEKISLVAVHNYHGLAVDVYKKNALEKLESILKKCKHNNEINVFKWTEGLMPDSIPSGEADDGNNKIGDWRESIRKCIKSDLDEQQVSLDKATKENFINKLISIKSFQFIDIEGCEKQAVALVANSNKLTFQTYELCLQINNGGKK